MFSDLNPNAVEWLVGGLFVSFYAYKRYDTSSYSEITKNRVTTAFSKFIIYFSFYLLTLFIIYWWFGSLLKSSPTLFAKLWPFFTGTGAPPPSLSQGVELERLTGPLVSALMLTTLLPTLPLLRSFDRWLLHRFWDLGHIPGHVFHQAKKLRRAPIVFSLRRRDEILRRAAELDIPADCVSFNQGRKLEYEWSRLCHLVIELTAWRDRKSGAYARYVSDDENGFENITISFLNTSRRVATFYRRRAAVESGEAKNDAKDIVDELEKDLIDSVRNIYKTTCVYLACGVFAAELTEKARKRRFTEIGFEQDAVRPRILTATQLITLILCVAITFIIISVFESYVQAPDGVFLGKIVFTALIMTVTYGLATVSGILPKRIWERGNIEYTGNRSYLAYFVASVFAVVLGLVAMITIRYTDNAIGGLGTEQNIDALSGDLGWSYPYLLQSAVIGYVVGFLTDSFRIRPRSPRRWHRWSDAAILGFAMLVGTTVVYGWMEGIGPLGPTRDAGHLGQANPFWFIGKGTAIGVIIGLLVPNWFRENRFRTPVQEIAQLLNRRARDISSEVAQLEPEQLEGALMTVSAYMASADGRVDAVEQQAARQIFFRMATSRLVTSPVDEIIGRFNKRATELEFSENRIAEDVLEPIRPLTGRAVLSEILVQLSLAIGHADGVFDDSEKEALASIRAELRLDEISAPVR